jgi:hypothetical protein
MKDFLYEVTLIGSTPIIHFEKNLNTLALRPTELKSKFDKFLLSKGYGNLATDTSDQRRKYFEYKVKIKEIRKNDRLSRPINRNDKVPFFFGNMGPDYHNGDKRFIFVEKIKLQFVSLNKNIIKAIRKEFPYFITVTNFGTRQNKGYGSFFIENESIEKYLPDNVYRFSIKKNHYKDVMKDLEIFYKFLRSGMNFSNRPREPFYTKPVIWKYFIDKGIVWEKRAIKRHCFRAQLQHQIEEHNNDEILAKNGNEKIVRDLLGLSVSQTWRGYGHNGKINIKKENPFIKRFKSPIFFKPIRNGNNYYIYMFEDKRVNEKLSDFLNKNFKIEAGNCEFDLMTVENFDLNVFLAWVYNKRKVLVDLLSNKVESKEYSVLKKSFLHTMQKVK